MRVGDGEYVPIGTDDNAPYRVFYDASHLRGQEPTTLSFRAIVNDLSGHLASDQVVNVGVEFPEPAEPATPYAVIHYNRPTATTATTPPATSTTSGACTCGATRIDLGEVTDWTSPKPFLGEDEYGRFAFVELTDDTVPVNFIVHRGDTKDPDNSPDRSFDPGDHAGDLAPPGRRHDLHVAGGGAGLRDRALRLRRLLAVTIDATSASGRS